MSIEALSLSEEDYRMTSMSLCGPDSYFWKAVCLVPFIGACATIIIDSSIERQIIQTNDRSRQIQLVELKNQYHTISMIRCLLSAVLAISTIMFPILFGVLAGLHSGAILQNARIIQRLKTDPTPFPFIVR